MEVLRRELPARGGQPDLPETWQRILEDLRILIIHAGGDSKRLPAYSPCGKIFVPVPGESDSAVTVTLFDRQIPTYIALPPAPPKAGQVVITSGDVLLSFDATGVRFDAPGITGLGCRAAAGDARNHGVYCADADGDVRLFLQKPSVDEQAAKGAVDRYDQSILDIGLMHFEAQTAVRLLQAFGVQHMPDGALAWSGRMGEAIEREGLDFYREICCAIGQEATAEHHIASARNSGSTWGEDLLRDLFQALHEIPFFVQVLPQCGFLHLGTTHQIIHSGLELLRMDEGISHPNTCLQIGNELRDEALVTGTNTWTEGCILASTLALGGYNVVAGVDVDEPLKLPLKACLSIIEGIGREGKRVWFVLCYGAADRFKGSLEEGALFCDRPVGRWLEAAGLEADDVWEVGMGPDRPTVWNARLFPAVRDPKAFRDFLWMFGPEEASPVQRLALINADRYSLAEISSLANQKVFFHRRARIRAWEIRESLKRLFRLESGFSAQDLAFSLESITPADRIPLLKSLFDDAQWHHRGDKSASRASFAFSRMIHTLGAALASMADSDDTLMGSLLPGLPDSMDPHQRTWLDEIGLSLTEETKVAEWSVKARAFAIEQIGISILTSGHRMSHPPVNALRSDEIVWGRAPARLDLGGGWTDTPPYSLEHGGCVINAAVNLNGQPPIHAYARVIPETVLRIGSIDLGTRIEISSLDELLDFRSATSEFALAKAALALSGFSPDAVNWPEDITLEMMLAAFGGGIELTTLAAIPKGSGLGTSSIVGAVILAVLQRVLGRQLTQQELFHGVLRLEQALTTGGGWQDQIGGAVAGIKIATTHPGLIPDARIHYMPDDVLDPVANGGLTLLYYTGITRLAKNILQQVVGRYLDRDRAAMDTLKRIHSLPIQVADALSRKDLAGFGGLIDTAWQLNKQLDPDSSNDQVEALMARIQPHVYGAKLLGAGGGGFLLMVCKSPADAAAVRKALTEEPPNSRARFFDFDISAEGLVVTVS
jgi:galactokinase/mevalonate kinase-like predicted kinase